MKKEKLLLRVYRTITIIALGMLIYSTQPYTDFNSNFSNHSVSMCSDDELDKKPLTQ